MPSNTQRDALTLAETYESKAFVLSFELFPPKTEKGRDALGRHLQRLLAFEPDFVTCTYGAGGSTRDKTLDTLALVQEMCELPVASHLTCVGATVDELRAYLRLAGERGVSHIVAIRGDAPSDGEGFQPTADGLRYGNELVALIRSEFPAFGIAVGGYPETHPEAPNAEVDMVNLKRKVDAGADVVVSQLFYTNDLFFRWRDRCVAAGIDVPVVPGILPITNFGQITRFTSMCGASLPVDLQERLRACGDDTDAQFAAGVAHATGQVTELIAAGAPGMHFYVLNQSAATTAVLGAVDLPR